MTPEDRAAACGADTEYMTARIAAAIRAAEHATREACAAIMLAASVPTGHGDTTEDLMREAVGEVKLAHAAAHQLRTDFAALRKNQGDSIE